ncbi:MAG: hypothetical protein BMS9Abin02_0935 [Anaerolineae bacterium]|nr:MAG: hypothetical protein BMS9Abin02_0935 [Anaerolineae bacterium]
MAQKISDQTPPLPGIIATLTTGFEFTTRHVWLTIIPIGLDIFYWLGPRMNITGIVSEVTALLADEPAYSGLAEEILAMAPRINLFTYLSVPVVGVPALMGGTIPENTPIKPISFELIDFQSWLLILIALTLLGFGLTTIYLSLISRVLKSEEGYEFPGILDFTGLTLLAIFRLVGLAVAFVITLFLLTLPLLPIAFIMGLINSALMFGVLLFAFLIVAAYLSLAVPGIIYNNRPIFKAIMESIRLVYGNMLPTINILLVVILIINGTNLLWLLADNGSWLTLVSIIGHAFISTGLAVAIIIFYRDRYLLLINSNSTPVQEEFPND